MITRGCFVIGSVFHSPLHAVKVIPQGPHTQSRFQSLKFFFALQSDGEQSISNIIMWFPGGELRLIDKSIHFLPGWGKKKKKKAKGDEKARRSQSVSKAQRAPKIQFTCDQSSSVLIVIRRRSVFCGVIGSMASTCSTCMCLCESVSCCRADLNMHVSDRLSAYMAAGLWKHWIIFSPPWRSSFKSLNAQSRRG